MDILNENNVVGLSADIMDIICCRFFSFLFFYIINKYRVLYYIFILLFSIIILFIMVERMSCAVTKFKATRKIVVYYC